AVYLLNAPLAQAARLAGALQAKRSEAGQDSLESLAGGGAAAARAGEVTEAPAEESPADESAEAIASDEETTEA
ncbi:MAG: 50S ribosomal protein L10, partial [Nocardioides sp.]